MLDRLCEAVSCCADLVGCLCIQETVADHQDPIIIEALMESSGAQLGSRDGAVGWEVFWGVEGDGTGGNHVSQVTSVRSPGGRIIEVKHRGFGERGKGRGDRLLAFLAHFESGFLLTSTKQSDQVNCRLKDRESMVRLSRDGLKIGKRSTRKCGMKEDRL